MTDTNNAKARLEEQLSELERRLGRIERDLAEPPEMDANERAVQLEDDDALGGQATLVRREIESTKRALARMEDGSYGECVQCGEEISAQRLEARPEAALCINCASSR